MGEANYYLLAEFESEDDAKFAERCARVILAELVAFYDEWQDIRTKTHKTVAERHKLLLKKFPLVRKYIWLPSPPKGREDPAMNYLAGYCDVTCDFELSSEGRYVKLHDYVWHFANWDNIAWLFYRLGAKKVVWYSDEYMDFWDVLRAKLEKCEGPRRRPKRIPRDELEVMLIASELGKA
jgi:hypothetical protein